MANSAPSFGERLLDKFDRIFALHAILSARRTPIPLEDLTDRLECSKATLHRIIGTMRTSLNAPIVSTERGYRYEQSTTGDAYQLPGLWFSGAELQSFAVLQRLVQDAGGGLLEEQLAPLAKRLEQLTKDRRLNLGEAASRLRFPAIAARPPGASFQIVADALLQRRRVRLTYHARGTDARTDRTVSPQRLTHYREGWYLDVWDHEREALRSFAVDRILTARILEQRARDVDERELDEHYASSYGIFGGKADKLAVLRFSKERARWVADERWHPDQVSHWPEDGRYELTVPYRDARELVMDILRQGPDVEVIGPAELREEVARKLREAAERYR
jgi:proteasome accessory factor C